ncbi:hypothetical protein [Entomospira culicis]|uniref:Uncharacterized protein n=1 Tax=Entomospira culicis TaxID=2719989 RepID=A0A968GFV9_9SPIO|nr:hypothetical protein [Entomospira culicis]NIZ19321.1 hypothetical protein [Entomospira culicis]NIZ69774.1 hypothetical protein [Entomospira culicis]WDI36885.1 hypothetical protein PVA46_06040 [Entomospira culicis]WDI38514.1 hypothetical protein PVA47_06050 [Entomospira culicis]
MKKWIAGMLLVLFMVPTAFAQATLKDGIYKANFEKANPTGYMPTLTIRVQKGVIISVVYDETDAKGVAKSKDAKTKKIFDEMAKELSSSQKAPLVKTQAPREILDNFNALAQAVLEQATKAATDTPIIVKGIAK